MIRHEIIEYWDMNGHFVDSYIYVEIFGRCFRLSRRTKKIEPDQIFV